MHAVARRGWRGVVPHWRGCSGEPNRLPRAYHSGDHAEAGWLLEAVAARAPDAPMFAVGVSLGGSALLNWLGRAGDAAAEQVRAAAAVSAPLSLRVGGEAIERGLNMIYTWNFMRTMRRKGLAKARQFPGLIDAERIRRSRTLYEFDDAFTAPLHGFASADDYWDRGSSLDWLSGIRVPTLLLNARNDPFFPLDRLPHPLSLPPVVELEVTEHGGHVGFLHARRREERDEADSPAAVAFGDPLWMPRRVLAFFEQRLPRVDAAEPDAATSASPGAPPERHVARAA
jgi:predicted alpha/beta-fold hydrolase